MKKTLLITENETDISCEVEGFSDIEIIGLLTYYRDKIEIACINRKSVQPENTLKRKTRIIDWLNKQENISFRLGTALNYLRKNMEFIEDIQKEKMLAIRNVSKGTWDEFVKLRAK